MKQLLTLLFLIVISSGLISQQSDFQRSFFLELGGSGGLASINYEKEFKKDPLNLSWRIGLSGNPIDKNNGFLFIIPTTIQGTVGKGNHKLIVGMGQGLSITTKARFFSRLTPSLGYRYQSPNNNLFYQIAYTPLVSYILDFQYQHWAGISIGYRLNS